MAWTRNDSGELRNGVEEVENLGEEEEEESFGEMSEDTNDGEGHAGEVAEGVSDERAGGIP